MAGDPLGIEVVETRSAGWAWRCHLCDLTVTGCRGELEAAEQARDHLASAQHVGRRPSVPSTKEPTE